MSSSLQYPPSPELSDRIEARRAFVEMKRTFMRAAAGLDAYDARTMQLLRKLRQAHEPEDLGALRGPVFAALRRDTVNGPALRQELRGVLDRVFRSTYSGTVF